MLVLMLVVVTSLMWCHRQHHMVSIPAVGCTRAPPATTTTLLPIIIVVPCTT
jgi:hypothetical protein